MNGASSRRKLSIFVHHASERLTDHESHGDGLICFSLLNGLAQRGHSISAVADSAAIRSPHPNLCVRTIVARSPIHSFISWEQSWRAERWLRHLIKTGSVDLIWRMHPYGGLPHVPPTGGRPLVIGPMFYGWPADSTPIPKSGQPRFGVSLKNIVAPFLRRGWREALQKASLLLCATHRHAAAMKQEVPSAQVLHLPVIVEPPSGFEPVARLPLDGIRPLRLVFVANLVAYKNPRVFCEAIKCLHEMGVPAKGRILGDGPERAALESYCREAGLEEAVDFAGKVPNSQVWNEVAGADFLVSTSIGEPYGRGIAEAMAMGTPPVCHCSGGPADFIEHGVSGLLIHRLEAADYAQEIAAFAPAAKWQTLSRKALQEAAAWRSDVVLDRLEERLLSLCQAG